MTREEIIQGLKFTVEMFMFDPNTGETRQEYELNDLDKTTVEACKGAMELLRQEPKPGHWIEKPNIYGVAYCSECGYGLKVDDTNYCPNCGAKMGSEVSE